MGTDFIRFFIFGFTNLIKENIMERSVHEYKRVKKVDWLLAYDIGLTIGGLAVLGFLFWFWFY